MALPFGQFIWNKHSSSVHTQLGVVIESQSMLSGFLSHRLNLLSIENKVFVFFDAP